MRRIRLILLFCFCSLGLSAQTYTRVFKENIRTLRVERTLLVMENGLVGVNDEADKLYISFDEMSHDVHFYTYTVQKLEFRGDHLELNNSLVSASYLVGFPRLDITDYEHSINTSREYTHYWFEFPNNDMLLAQSGAYRLTIYEDGNPDDRVAEIDFCVVEPLVQIDAKVRANTDIEYNGRYQQVDIDVDTKALDLREPGEVRVVVTQNNRIDNAVSLKQPTFVEPNRLRYINNRSLIFEGGNEYHHFDAFSCFYAGHGIDRVFHENGDYHVILLPDEVTQGQYIHEFDSDGRFIVNAERTNDPDTEAEYMWAHWTLPMEKPFFDGALYVGGDLFNNEMTLRNRMQYDNEAKCYWLTALVKQGGYDYQYWFVPKNQITNQKSQITNTITTTQRVDGSYWQTENTYTIYVYWRPFGAQYDRLVGVKQVSL